MQHPNEGFFDAITIHADVNKKDLLNFLLLEYSEMRTIDGNSERFYLHVINFFNIHKWNIDKLIESQNFTYNPLDTYHGTEHRTEDISTVENVDTDVDYHEDGSGSTHTVNFVSGFNDVRSPNGKTYIDSEHDRQEQTTSYEKDGNSTTDKDRTQEVGEDEHIKKEGNDGKTYQSLIEEERAQAEFNLYKWIARHFSRELLVCVW